MITARAKAASRSGSTRSPAHSRQQPRTKRLRPLPRLLRVPLSPPLSQPPLVLPSPPLSRPPLVQRPQHFPRPASPRQAWPATSCLARCCCWRPALRCCACVGAPSNLFLAIVLLLFIRRVKRSRTFCAQ